MTAISRRPSIPVQFLLGVLVAIVVVGIWIAASLIGIRMNASQPIALILVIWGALYTSVGLRSVAAAVALLVVFFVAYYLIASHGFQI